MKHEQIISGVAQRYARSLLELGEEQGRTDVIRDEFAGLSQALQESHELRFLVNTPLLRAKDQIDALDKLLHAMKISGLTANFVKLLASNRRLKLLPQTIIAFRQLLDESRGVTTAEVTSAEPLTESQIAALKNSLKETLGKDVSLKPHVDQSLIGGLVIKLGSRMIDTSLKTRLMTMKTALKGIT